MQSRPRKTGKKTVAGTFLYSCLKPTMPELLKVTRSTQAMPGRMRKLFHDVF